MSALTTFSFENLPVRTFGTADAPLFIALDVCNALGYKRARDAVAQHVDPEDLIKVEIDTAGGKQTLNATSNSCGASIRHTLHPCGKPFTTSTG